ncbi:MAG: ATP phosphoribosyltransferase regulatory subunit [Anaerolineae bacterium]
MPKPKIQPRLPKGMRDFLPQEMIKREYVFGIVRDVFHLYGFEPLQTPVLELHETLMGKYGEDAEKLIFNAQHPGGKEELALRYDSDRAAGARRRPVPERHRAAVQALPAQPGVARRAPSARALPRVLPV